MRLCLFLVGASCNKSHGASCNTNKFINFVESVRHKKALPYGLVWVLNVINVFLKMIDAGEPDQPKNRRKMLRFNTFIMAILQFIITSTCRQVLRGNFFFLSFFFFFFFSCDKGVNCYKIWQVKLF